MDFSHALESAEENIRNERDKHARFRKGRPKLRRFLVGLSKLPSSTDIRSLGVSGSYLDEHNANVAIYLSEERQATTLLREIVRDFHIPIRKSPSWDGKALTAEFTLDGLSVRVYGYKPSTCKVVTEEVIEKVTDAQIAEDGTVYRRVQKSRVVCDPPE